MMALGRYTACLLALFLIGVTVPAAATATKPSAVVSAPTAKAPQGFAEIAGCISGAENLLVSLVVDESLSLRSTDPRSLRVRGITTAVDSLEQLAAQVGDSTSVEVSLSTFARSYETLANWRQLTPRTAQQLRTTAARTLPGRDAGDATDYRQALIGAKRDLDQRQRQLGDPAACKLLLWFTDGALDVDAQTDAARQALCQVGGIADAVRDDGISIVALALFTRGGGVTDEQRSELRAVAEGRAGSVHCGTTPIPSDSATGVYLPADDPAALQRLFAGAGALVAGGTEVGTATCPSPDCAGGHYLLNVDAGVSGARVLIQGKAQPRIEVTSPTGQTLVLNNGESRESDGATVSYLVRDQLATVNVLFAPYARERSRWTITPQPNSELSVYWFWGAGLVLETSEVRAGSAHDIAIRVVDQADGPLDLGLYRNARATLTVNGRQLDSRITRDGTLRGRLDLGVDNLPASLPVAASLSVRSKPSGVALGPIALSARLPVTLPPSYPSVTPKELDFGQLEGLGTARAELRVTGSQLGPTQVCVTGSQIRLPGSESVQDLVSASPDCVDVSAGEQESLTLSLSPKTSVDGQATGPVTLTMSAADGSDDLELSVPSRLEMARVVDESTRWALVAALLALSLLVPALLLVGSNLLLARFKMTSMARTATKSVRVTPRGLESLDGGPLLEPENFQNASFSGTRQGGRLPLDSTGITLKGRRIFSLKEPIGVALSPAHQILISAMTPYQGKTPGEAPVALGEVDATFVVLNPSGATSTEASGSLIMTIPGHVDRAGIHDRASRMSNIPPWEAILAKVSGPDTEMPAAKKPARRAGRSSTPDESVGEAPWEQGESGAPDSPAADEPPPMPWETGAPGGSTPSSTATPRKSRTFGRKKATAPPPAQPPQGSQDDDSLPPLPDFLK